MKPGLEAGFADEAVGIDVNGNPVVVTKWVLSPDEFGQVRTGYRCLRCMEPFQSAFPKECGLCGYEVAARQTIDLMREHTGEHRYGPTPLEDIYAIEDEKAERAKPGWATTGSGIVVPNSLN